MAWSLGLESDAETQLHVPATCDIARRGVSIGVVSITRLGYDVAGSARRYDLVYHNRTHVVGISVGRTPTLVEHVGEVDYVERKLEAHEILQVDALAEVEVDVVFPIGHARIALCVLAAVRSCVAVALNPVFKELTCLIGSGNIALLIRRRDEVHFAQLVFRRDVEEVVSAPAVAIEVIFLVHREAVASAGSSGVDDAN